VSYQVFLILAWFLFILHIFAIHFVQIINTLLMKHAFLWLFLSLGAVQVSGQDKLSYILAYKDIAIAEMHRTGIPASIKLSQAVLESNYGRSELAREAKNHFGIKCGGDWTGQGYHLHDDDRDARGQLVHSCFRVFGSPEESYIAHSEFLMDPRKSQRYGMLFTLERTDYKGWAHGLSRGGYATNPSYANLLIRIIEEQRLHEYDYAPAPEPGIEYHSPHPRDDVYVAPPESGLLHYAIQYQNNIPYITARSGDNVRDLSKQTDIAPKKLIRYNTLEKNRRSPLDEGERIYLQPLKRKYSGDAAYHTVEYGESLAGIAHLYGVKVQVLRKRNHIPEGCEPAPGTRIALRDRSKTPVRCATGHESPAIIAEAPAGGHHPVMPEPLSSTSAMREEEQQPETLAGQTVEVGIYTVRPKDTLYQIARLHGISVAELKALNKLTSDTIYPGQSLNVR
jgi:LysM repeat protein